MAPPRSAFRLLKFTVGGLGTVANAASVGGLRLLECRCGNRLETVGCDRVIERLPLVPVELAVAEIVRTYIAQKVMPRDPVGDALHLALASHHRCDFLVTWNCHHLANANKFDHIRRVNAMMGFVPALVTPLELLGDDDEERG